MNTTASTLVRQAAHGVRTMNAIEFAEQLDLGDSVLVDVREADERVRDGSIRGAIHIPRGMLEFRADPTDAAFDTRLRHHPRVLVYCATGDRSALAAETMSMLGHADVAHLDGGVRAWSRASLPLYGGQVDPY